jgi:GT2 family glycosyltransferase
MGVTKKMGVVIVTLNMRPYTSLCVEAINNSPDRNICHIIIVDNGSLPKTREGHQAMLDTGLVDQVVQLEENMGYAAGCNAGIDAMPKEIQHIAFAHNDVVVMSGWATKILAHFENDDVDEMAVVFPLTNYANEGSSRVDHVYRMFTGQPDVEGGDPREPIKLPNKTMKALRVNLDGCLERMYPSGLDAFAEKLVSEWANPVTVCYSPEISSYCMVVARNVLDDAEIGKFDERFWPRGWEDKLFFHKLQRKGYECWIARDVYVHHFGNVTSDGPGFEFPKIMSENENLYKKICADFSSNLKNIKPQVLSSEGKPPNLLE